MKEIKKFPARSLFVSRPNPSWFGNPPNSKSTSAWTEPDWLVSRFHFSFAEYSNPDRSGFGALRVCNDDLVQPSRGFGTHPHRNMEIVTYVVDGELTHQDSMGTKETLQTGSIQFMSAGTGVTHSEANESKDSTLRFIQIWIVPRAYGTKPKYGSFSRNAPSQSWEQLVSDVNSSKMTPVKINQDANIIAGEISEDIELRVEDGRQMYLLCIDGNARLGDTGLQTRDACEITGPCTIPVSISGKTHLLGVDVRS